MIQMTADLLKSRFVFEFLGFNIEKIAEKLGALNLDFMMNLDHFARAPKISNRGEQQYSKHHLLELEKYFHDSETYISNAHIETIIETFPIKLDPNILSVFPTDNVGQIKFQGPDEESARKSNLIFRNK